MKIIPICEPAIWRGAGRLRIAVNALKLRTAAAGFDYVPGVLWHGHPCMPAGFVRL
ncbi:hypothetical protein D3C81_1947800 [compost metagenome]